MSDETKRKLSKSHLGRKYNIINGHPPLSEEHKKKISEFQKSKKRNPCSEETKKKISRANKGKKHPYKKRKPFTEEHKRNIGLARIGRKRPHTEETKRKIGIANSGIKSGSWNGGSSRFPYPLEWRESLKKYIRERDGHRCQWCGKHQDKIKISLHVHHIDYDKENLDPNNLISLCPSCHIKTNFNRDYWELKLREKLRKELFK